MAASSSQPAGPALWMIHPFPSCGNANKGNLAPEELLRGVGGTSHVARGSSFRAIAGGLRQCEPRSGITAVEILWRQSLLGPTLRCDSRQDTKRCLSPEFRLQESEKVLWLNNSRKPPWVDEQMAVLDRQLGAPASSSLSTLPHRVSDNDVTADAVRNLCEKGQLSEAIDALDVLVRTKSPASSSLFYSVLKSCLAQKNLVLGRRVHELTVKVGYDSNTFLATHIVRMYASHGRLQEVKDVFTRVTRPSAFSWSAVIAAHAKHGEPKQAIELYKRMRCSSVKPEGHVFVAALQACAIARDLESGKQVHADVLNCGAEPNVFVLNCLVDMYAKCGNLPDARALFDSLVTRDVVTWTSMIAAYAQNEQGQEALSLYEQMEVEGVVLADPVTFACLLKASARVGALQQGKRLHSQIIERRLEGDIVVGTCLVDMYAKCGRLEEALKGFDSLPRKDVVTWNAMIAGYVENGCGQEALEIYARMEHEGVTVPDSVTFASLLKASGSIGALRKGRQLHQQIIDRGLEAGILVVNSLVDMYAKCGMLEDARRVFDSLPTMDVLTSNTMIAGYTKCGRLDDARRIFDSLVAKNVVTWTTMISAYAEHERGQESIALYNRMEQEGMILANAFTFSCLLKACETLGALQQGKHLHSQVLDRGLKGDIVVGTCLVGMYVKCGRVEDAQKVFDSLPTKNVVTWTMMIDGFGQCNESHKAIECFQEMLRHGVEPNEATFTCLLVACSHAGLVYKGQQFFKTMVEEHGIKPTVEHHTCMVDLLGRAGYLEEAEKKLSSFESNTVGYMSLLNACKCHGDIERGTRCFESLIRSDPQNASAYVLMGNIYATAGSWADVDRIDKLRKSAGARKKPAVAGIEVERHVHTFVVGEDRGDIFSKVQSTSSRLKDEGGHLPLTELVLKGVPEMDKEDDLCGHAEKLALAYGLLNTPDGTPLLVTKNLRMCGDCHSSTEIMSRIEKREIIVRDAHRVHRFVDGSCRCGGRP